MAYNLSVNSSANAVIDAGNFSIGKSGTLQVSSSNAIQANVTVNSSGWTSIPLGVLNDVAYISIYNDNTVNSASVVQLATGSSGQNILTTIQPGLGTLIAWSGSLSLYGKVFPTTINPGTTGIIQYYAQQS